MRGRFERVGLVAGKTGERSHGAPRRAATLTALEYQLGGMVVFVVLLFEAWFFFFSGSPFDQRSGR